MSATVSDFAVRIATREGANDENRVAVLRSMKSVAKQKRFSNWKMFESLFHATEGGGEVSNSTRPCQ